jgi:hypothetical protein
MNGNGDHSSVMRDMSRAIRHELQEHGPTLQDVPDEVLRDLVQVVGAFALDLREELERRMRLQGHDFALAEELGVRYAVRCTCGHVLVTSDRPIEVPQVLPCCKTGTCPYCAPDETEGNREWVDPAYGGGGTWVHDPERHPGFDVGEDPA